MSLSAAARRGLSNKGSQPRTARRIAILVIQSPSAATQWWLERAVLETRPLSLSAAARRGPSDRYSRPRTARHLTILLPQSPSAAIRWWSERRMPTSAQMQSKARPMSLPASCVRRLRSIPPRCPTARPAVRITGASRHQPASGLVQLLGLFRHAAGGADARSHDR